MPFPPPTHPRSAPSADATSLAPEDPLPEPWPSPEVPAPVRAPMSAALLPGAASGSVSPAAPDVASPSPSASAGVAPPRRAELPAAGVGAGGGLLGGGEGTTGAGTGTGTGTGLGATGLGGTPVISCELEAELEGPDRELRATDTRLLDAPSSEGSSSVVVSPSAAASLNPEKNAKRLALAQEEEASAGSVSLSLDPEPAPLPALEAVPLPALEAVPLPPAPLPPFRGLIHRAHSAGHWLRQFCQASGHWASSRLQSEGQSEGQSAADQGRLAPDPLPGEPEPARAPLNRAALRPPRPPPVVFWPAEAADTPVVTVETDAESPAPPLPLAVPETATRAPSVDRLAVDALTVPPLFWLEAKVPDEARLDPSARSCLRASLSAEGGWGTLSRQVGGSQTQTNDTASACYQRRT